MTPPPPKKTIQINKKVKKKKCVHEIKTDETNRNQQKIHQDQKLPRKVLIVPKPYHKAQTICEYLGREWVLTRSAV